MEQVKSLLENTFKCLRLKFETKCALQIACYVSEYVSYYQQLLFCEAKAKFLKLKIYLFIFETYTHFNMIC